MFLRLLFELRSQVFTNDIGNKLILKERVLCRHRHSHHNGSCSFTQNCPTNQQRLFDVAKSHLRDRAALNTAISHYQRIFGTVFSSPVDKA